MPQPYLIFDLDDTLYPPGNGLWDEIGQRINQFMVERMGVDPAGVNNLRRQYYLEHGTSLRGLRTDYPGFDPHAYLAFVHAVDLARYLAPDPALEAMLTGLSMPKAIFTNSDRLHARRVLERLGVAHHFETVVDIVDMQFENKPRPRAYETLLSTLHISARDCIFVEDSLRNLVPAKALGMTTVLVGVGHPPHPAVDHNATTILDVGPLVSRLAADGQWQAARQPQ